MRGWTIVHSEGGSYRSFFRILRACESGGAGEEVSDSVEICGVMGGFRENLATTVTADRSKVWEWSVRWDLSGQGEMFRIDLLSGDWSAQADPTYV